VGDENVGEREFALEVLQQEKNLRADGDIQSRDRLYGPHPSVYGGQFHGQSAHFQQGGHHVDHTHECKIVELSLDKQSQGESYLSEDGKPSPLATRSYLAGTETKEAQVRMTRAGCV